MKTSVSLIASICSLLLLVGCASTPNGKNWKENKKIRERGMPSKLKLEKEDTPLEVQEIEVQIDRKSVILAEEATVYVSKNYEFDISLTGDDVTRDLDSTGGNETLAQGMATAFIRNLKIRCERSIRVKIADFGTKPFIKISARGHCSHIILGDNNGRHEVKRARKIQIDNDQLRYVGTLDETAVSQK